MFKIIQRIKVLSAAKMYFGIRKIAAKYELNINYGLFNLKPILNYGILVDE